MNAVLRCGAAGKHAPDGELDSTTNLDMDNACCRMGRDRFVRVASRSLVSASLVRADEGSGVESVLVA